MKLRKKIRQPKDEVPLVKVFNDAGVVFCGTCNVGYPDSENKLAIKKTGECLSCNHVRAEAGEKAKELWENEVTL
jgi:hypothetical protein